MSNGDAPRVTPNEPQLPGQADRPDPMNPPAPTDTAEPHPLRHGAMDGRRRFDGAGLDEYASPRGILGIIAARRGVVIPDLDAFADAEPLPARIYQDKWIVDCPDCGTGAFVWLDRPQMLCAGCFNAAVGGLWRRVELPQAFELREVELVLGHRLMADQRNWTPGVETPDDLRLENHDRGLFVPAAVYPRPGARGLEHALSERERQAPAKEAYERALAEEAAEQENATRAARMLEAAGLAPPGSAPPPTDAELRHMVLMTPEEAAAVTRRMERAAAAGRDILDLTPGDRLWDDPPGWKPEAQPAAPEGEAPPPGQQRIVEAVPMAREPKGAAPIPRALRIKKGARRGV